MTAQLVGFVIDLPGNEGHLLQSDPVVRVDGREYVANAENWSNGDLVTLRPDDADYVHRITTEKQLNEGESVWLAGPHFFNDLLKALQGSDVVRSMGGWRVLPTGFRWTTGASSSFADFSQKLSHLLEKRLFALLAEEGPGPLADCAARLFEVVETTRDSERLVALGLFYSQSLDRYAYSLVREEARGNRYFLTNAGFDRAVEKLKVRVTENSIKQSVELATRAAEARRIVLGHYKMQQILRNAASHGIRVESSLYLVDDFNVPRRISGLMNGLNQWPAIEASRSEGEAITHE